MSDGKAISTARKAFVRVAGTAKKGLARAATAARKVFARPVRALGAAFARMVGAAAKRRRTWARIALRSAGVALLAFTLYVGALMLLWNQRVADLRDIGADLEGQRTAAEIAIEAGGASAAETQSELDAAHADLLVSANHAVTAQDYALLFSYAGIAMKECINVEEDVAFYVRYKYTADRYPWPNIHAYDDAVKKACKTIRKAFDQAVDDLDAVVGDPEATEDPS